MIPRWLSHQMCDVLVEHIDGEVAIDVQDHVKMTSKKALVERGLLRIWSPRGGQRQGRPRFTYLSEPGRAMLAAVLAHYADALVRAGRLSPGDVSIPDVPKAAE